MTVDAEQAGMNLLGSAVLLGFSQPSPALTENGSISKNITEQQLGG